MDENSYLRLFPVGDIPSAEVTHPAAFTGVFQAFEEATGWTLGFNETRNSYETREQFSLPASAADGHFFIDDLSVEISAERKPIERARSEKLTEALNEIVRELARTKGDLRLAQAELATTCPINVRPYDEQRMLNFFQQLLKTALNCAGYESAAICIMDEQNKTMGFRVVAGEHFDSLLGIHRDLRHCPADLEALAGSIVTLNKKSEVAVWNVPIECRSAVCLPIASLDNLIGTLWLVSDRRKQLSDQNANVLEIIAGRIACEIERAGLVKRVELALAETQIVYRTRSTGHLRRATVTPFPEWELTPGNQAAMNGEDHHHFALYRVTPSEKLAILVTQIQPAESESADEIAAEIESAFHILSLTQLPVNDWGRTIKQHLTTRLETNIPVEFSLVIVDPFTGEFQIVNSGALQWARVDGTQLSRVINRNAERATLQTGQGFLPRGTGLQVATHELSKDNLLLQIRRRSKE